jgi:peroxiredoxin Q/BCP
MTLIPLLLLFAQQGSPATAPASRPAAKPLAVGDEAPEIVLPDQGGKEVKLSSFRGKSRVLLAFYPKDDTPGWTLELSRFRDEFQEFLDAKTQVLGISIDPVDSHAKFADKLKLPYPILADADGKVTKRYGVFVDRYGGIAARSLFLLDEKGKLLYVDRDYSLKGDADHDALLEAVRGKAPASAPAGATTKPGPTGRG